MALFPEIIDKSTLMSGTSKLKKLKKVMDKLHNELIMHMDIIIKQYRKLSEEIVILRTAIYRKEYRRLESFVKRINSLRCTIKIRSKIINENIIDDDWRKHLKETLGNNVIKSTVSKKPTHICASCYIYSGNCEYFCETSEKIKLSDKRCSRGHRVYDNGCFVEFCPGCNAFTRNEKEVHIIKSINSSVNFKILDENIPETYRNGYMKLSSYLLTNSNYINQLEFIDKMDEKVIDDFEKHYYLVKFYNSAYDYSNRGKNYKALPDRYKQYICGKNLNKIKL